MARTLEDAPRRTLLDVVTIKVREQRIEVDKIPDECPICHRGLQPEAVGFSFIGNWGFAIAFQCPRSDCREMFVARYATARLSNGTSVTTLMEVAPKTAPKPAIPKSVVAVSAAFVEILGQAAAAEAFGLSLIAGSGYRKGLEFLVKDYCIHEHPSQAEVIRSLWLGECIKRFVDDGRVKVAAERATWLANDEVHYTRKWEGKDLEDLKILIRLVINWIDSSLLTAQVEKDMPPGKP
jgi:hypothetical protein